MGSIRQTISSNGTIYAAQYFYPCGSAVRSYNNGLVYERFKFTEKERDTETGYDYFGVRLYDAEIGRWLSADPLASQYMEIFNK